MPKLTIAGPFTMDEIRRITAVLQDIESMRPDENFVIDADLNDTDGSMTLEQMFEAMSPPPLPGYQRSEAVLKRSEAVEHHYRIFWHIPADDVTVQLGLPADKEQLFDGADGQQRAREMLDLLRASGICSNIRVEHRVASVRHGEWESVQEVDQ